MPSPLASLSTEASSYSTAAFYPKQIKPSPRFEQKKMSISQTFYLAHTARGKLASEAARPDHDLRLLVGHANLLDGLMIELSEAEQEQERWFDQSVKGAAKASEEPKHIRWADTIVEESEKDWSLEDLDDSDSDSDDSDYEEDEDLDIEMIAPPSRAAPAQPISYTVSSQEVEEDEDEEFEDEEDLADLALVRTSSQHPPELSHDSDDSEDESMPPSPPQLTLELSEKERQRIATTSFYEPKQPTPSQQDSISPSDQAVFFENDYYLTQGAAPMVSAY
ncbi:hypothetical protein L228DRAFT_247107 [Xylona heveae TC161]|uniref:Uncharacterized protein n=1 Tax=Xylona heveae (strain CBS 132557 / TC161) TaxID=1328760 RepID=A0A165GXS4_XYLHT|nr:hypothetical protein L228DRAFT_247107 [Xylona heveae TC161]KZF22735.1 hypothetical protein L228DRAFT_247107 [Xylona heveae TC161]